MKKAENFQFANFVLRQNFDDCIAQYEALFTLHLPWPILHFGALFEVQTSKNLYLLFFYPFPGFGPHVAQFFLVGFLLQRRKKNILVIHRKFQILFSVSFCKNKLEKKKLMNIYIGQAYICMYVYQPACELSSDSFRFRFLLFIDLGPHIYFC